MDLQQISHFGRLLRITYLGRCFGRDMVLVVVGGIRQAFCRSTGINSHLPGAWLPFDGIRATTRGVLLRPWLDKSRFVRCEEHDYLFRFGTMEHRFISEELANVAIPALPDELPSAINRVLGYAQAEELLMVFGSERVDRAIDDAARRFVAKSEELLPQAAGANV
jgi:hypothetical protein